MITFKFSRTSAFLYYRIICIFLFFCLGNIVKAQNVPVPENIQAALLSKVLKFNPDLPKTIKMLVVYDNNTQLNKDKFIEGLSNSISVKAIKSIELEKFISNSNVVYFMQGIHDSSRLCKANKVLSVTGTAQYVEGGEISLGFGVENNKPKILVNLASLEQEGQSFSSDILRIAKIFK